MTQGISFGISLGDHLCCYFIYIYIYLVTSDDIVLPEKSNRNNKNLKNETFFFFVLDPSSRHKDGCRFRNLRSIA